MQNKYSIRCTSAQDSKFCFSSSLIAIGEFCRVSSCPSLSSRAMIVLFYRLARLLCTVGAPSRSVKTIDDEVDKLKLKIML